MKSLVIDLGSTHFKARVYEGLKPINGVVKAKVTTDYRGTWVELRSEALDRALVSVLKQLGRQSATVERIIFSNQAPCLALQSKAGQLLCPLITHLDRRSIEQAQFLENEFGRNWWLTVTGNRPYPGGVAVTTLWWLKKNASMIFNRSHTFGSLGSYVANRFTGRNYIDSGNACLMGLYDVAGRKDWNREILRFLGIELSQLPQIKEAGVSCGELKRNVARTFGLRCGIPVLVGLVDSSACALGGDLSDGDLLHSCGTTDVIATILPEPYPDEKYLTRALGIDGKWLALRTIASSGSTLQWCEGIFGQKIPLPSKKTTDVRFDPYLAGDRLSLESRRGALSQLTLATSREDIVNSIYLALGAQSAESVSALSSRLSLNGKVCWSGGNSSLARWYHSIWKREFKLNWKFAYFEEMGLLGLAKLVQKGVHNDIAYDRTG